MEVIGIVGGVASGKSLVAQQLQSLGAEVIDADVLGHRVLEDDEVREALRSRWGEEVFDAAGKVNRPAIAQRVFAPPPEGPRQLAFLEAWTHPRIGRRMQQRLAELADAGQCKAVVLDAALLLKAGWDQFCTRILFVEAPQSQRVERVRQRAWSEAELVSREAAQENLAEKRKRADWVIDNGGSPGHTFAQVQQFWQTLG